MKSVKSSLSVQGIKIITPAMIVAAVKPLQSETLFFEKSEI
jgi:hypothetical protein